MNERQLPWSRSCFVCGDENPRGLGVRFVAEDNRVVLRTEIDRCFEGYPGHVHGGVITALMDEVSAWAISIAQHRFCLTKEITVKFHRPIPAGKPIVVLGEAKADIGGELTASATIEDSDGRILATSDGVFVPIPETIHESIVTLLKMPGREADLEDV